MDDLIIPFYLFLNKFVTLSRAEFEETILPHVVVRRFDAKEVITGIGTIENYFNFLLSGLSRSYYLKESQEVVVQLATEDQMIHVQESFHSRTPSVYCVEAIEASRVASITYDGLESIYAGSNKMQYLGRMIVTYALLLKEKMQVQAATLSPRERFLQFMEQNPTLLQRVPQKHIASYLNIQPETFSRFKHLLREKKVE